MKFFKRTPNIYVYIVLHNIIFAIMYMIFGKYYSSQYHKVWSFDVVLNITMGTALGIMEYKSDMREFKGNEFDKKRELIDNFILFIIGIVSYILISNGIRIMENKMGIQIPIKFILSK